MTTLDTIQHYWFLIVFIASVIASWVRYESKIGTHGEKITELEKRLKALEEATDSFREQIKVDIQEIKTTMTFIRDAIGDLKNKLK